jgi:uncharacterized Fe-S radical SAM superfamily protein PflX
MVELAPPPFEKCSFRERRCGVDRTREMRERAHRGFDVIARKLILSREPGGRRFAFARPP